MAEKFYSGAYGRIRRLTLVIGAVTSLVVWVVFGWQPALGFLVGSGIAYVNFYWLKQAVSALAGRATSSDCRQSSRGIVLRFLLRYALIALAAYAILTVSIASLYGLLGGLFVTVAAILCEACFEAYVAVRKGL